MKINRLLILVFVALVFFVPTTNVFANTYESTLSNGKKVTIDIESTTVEGRENQTNISGTKPQVTSNDISTKQVNDKIDSIVKSATKNAASERAKSITFSYEVYQSGEYVSIVIYSKVLNAIEYSQADTVTFKVSDGKILTLSDVLGGKPITVVNTYVNNELKKEGKYANEVSITDGCNFYMSDGKPVIVFDSYALGQNQPDIVSMPVDLSKITSYQLSSNDYYIKDKFNTRMLPLRKVCEGLYYNVTWNNVTRTFVVTDSNVVSTGKENSNVYTYNNRKINLEYKPDNSNGVLYVPISYFTDILGLSYKIDNSGDITFYRIK